MEPFNFIDMLNWVFWNRTVSIFNGNIWKYEELKHTNFYKDDNSALNDLKRVDMPSNKQP